MEGLLLIGFVAIYKRVVVYSHESVSVSVILESAALRDEARLLPIRCVLLNTIGTSRTVCVQSSRL